MGTDTIAFVDSIPQGTRPFHEAAIRLHPDDDVAILNMHVPAGTILNQQHESEAPADLHVRRLIPSGHKIALHDIAQGAPIRRQLLSDRSRCLSGIHESGLVKQLRREEQAQLGKELT